MDSFIKIRSRSPRPPKATFKSFLSPNGKSTGPDEKGSYSTDTIEDGCSWSKAEIDLNADILLMPGEIVIQRTEEVSRCNLVGFEKLDPVGTLFVTNYRVVFIPNASSPTNGKFDVARTNKLIGMDDVGLSSIFAVYHIAKGKRRRLIPNTLISGFVKRLQLHCKDFRVHQFCFKNSLRDHVKVTVNAIVYHYCPINVELLFTFAYNSCAPDDDGQPPVPEFLVADDWRFELKRLRGNGFEVSDCNREFAMSDSLPESFVLPTSLTEHQIQKSGLNSSNKCFPVWSCSHRNGCALIRMASGRPETEEEMLEFVRRSHPRLLPPEVVDVEATALPSPRKLQANFDQLRDLCMPSTYKELVNTDNSWLSLLESCQWLFFVSAALNVATDVVDKMVAKSKTVVIKERDGTDYNALICGLAQLMFDVESRTIAGFQSLVEKEWVALGHRFALRCDIVCAKDPEPSPIFLLFLDCVWQLLRQFPSSFEFTEIFLISIWDSVGLGMFRNFVYNGPLDRLNVQSSILESQLPRPNQTTSKTPFPKSVWDWKSQFSPEDITFFSNPLFSAAEQFRGLPDGTKPDNCAAKAETLVPCCLVAALNFWDNCYLRWLGPLQIIGGGQPTEYVAQTLIMEDITGLQMAIAELEETSAAKPRASERRRNRVTPFVFGDAGSFLRRQLSRHVSSSYPFSPGRLTTHTLLLPVPSPDNRGSVNDDTVSIDEISFADV